MLTTDQQAVLDALRRAKALAKEYRALTGRPLGCTGEIAEYEAVRLLDLQLAPVRQPGYDAIRATADGGHRLQIKGRCVLPGASRGQRLGRIDCSKEWDGVLLVLLDANLDATEIWEADRAAAIGALKAPGSQSRNVRGALAVSTFKSIGNRIWTRP
jgi:hypothetical protein